MVTVLWSIINVAVRPLHHNIRRRMVSMPRFVHFWPYFLARLAVAAKREEILRLRRGIDSIVLPVVRWRQCHTWKWRGRVWLNPLTKIVETKKHVLSVLE